MASMIRTFLLASAVLLLAASTYADTSPKANISFRTVSVGVQLNDIYIRSDNEFVPLVVNSNFISLESYSYAGPAKMALYRKAKASEKDTYKIATEVNLPPSKEEQAKKYLLIFSTFHGGGISTTLVPYDVQSYPPDSACIVNTMPIDVGLKVNKKVATLKPNESKIFPTGSQKTEIRVAAEMKSRDKWVEVNNNLFTTKPDSRLTVFLFDRSRPDPPATRVPSVGFLSFIE